MTSAQHRNWLKAGGPVSGLIRPMARMRDLLRRYGYTVYDLGNSRHLDADPPEDHTPYSETGWPRRSPRWWLHAIDIMPPPPRSGLPLLQQLGAQLYRDKQAGHPGVAWLKYMNWGPQSDSSAVQDSWRPDHQRSASKDAGHIHLSGRTDMTGYAGADDYDPVARIRGGQPPPADPAAPTQGEPTMFLVKPANSATVYLSDGAHSYPFGAADTDLFDYLRSRLPFYEGVAPKNFTILTTFAKDPPPAITLTDAQVRLFAQTLGLTPDSIKAAARAAINGALDDDPNT